VEEERAATQLIGSDTLRRICGACPILEACLDYGMKHENYGVWGGLLTKERNALKVRHNSPLKKKATEELLTFGLPIEKIEAMADEYSSDERSVANEFTYYREDDSPRYR
jgi:hypothetical protein